MNSIATVGRSLDEIVMNEMEVPIFTRPEENQGLIGSFSRFAFHPDRAALLLNQGFGNGQSQTKPRTSERVFTAIKAVYDILSLPA